MSEGRGSGPWAMNRRDFLKLSGAGVLGASLLSSCSRVTSGFTGAETVPEGTLVFSHGPDASGTVPKIIDKFNKENSDGISVLFREAPADSGQYFDKLRTEFQAGGGGTIDIISGDVVWPAQFGPNKWTLDLSDRFTEEMRKDFLESTIQTNIFDGKLYGVPWFTDAGMLFYRTDLLEKAGMSEPPKTWDELIEMAREVREKTGTKYGFIFQGAEYEGGVVNGLEFVYNAGAEVFPEDDPTKVVLDQGGGADKGLAMQQRLVEEGIAPQAVATYKELESQTAFILGDAVFMRNWPFVYGTVLGGKATGSEIKPEQVGIAPIPTLEEGGQSFSGQGGWNFFINAQTEKADDCFKFIEWMIQPEIQKEFAINASFLPPRASLYEDKQLLKDQPVIELAKDIATRTKPRPRHPFYSDMSLVMAEQFNEVVKLNTSPQSAVAVMQTELERLASIGTQVYDLA
jgi:multiple sugar transport system substrate-binding protein